MHLSKKTLAEIKKLRNNIIEGSITNYCVEYLKSINIAHDNLWEKVSEEYANQYQIDYNIFEEKQQNHARIFHTFTDNIFEMIAILENSDTNEDKINKMINVVNDLRAVMAQDIKPKEYFDEDSSWITARNSALNELLIFKHFQPKIRIFNGNPALFDL